LLMEQRIASDRRSPQANKTLSKVAVDLKI
jgi:hypothetical protein